MVEDGAIIRKENLEIQIRFRADAGYSRASRYALARRVGAGDAIGIPPPKNKRLVAKVQEMEKHVREIDVQKGEKHIAWQALEYQAQSWAHQERIVVKIESTGRALHTRFMETNLIGTAKEIDRAFDVQ
ncbi:MAG: transposase [Flavobacteriaceae bacterium]|nr:transposase [Flavobacteriaceae bacterium]